MVEVIDWMRMSFFVIKKLAFPGSKSMNFSQHITIGLLIDSRVKERHAQIFSQIFGDRGKTDGTKIISNRTGLIRRVVDNRFLQVNCLARCFAKHI